MWGGVRNYSRDGAGVRDYWRDGAGSEVTPEMG